ncbi:hypothetical protein BDR06DRAFT_361219 [Suillus hirtellus]|nr:hypothetical protein BDR06DRAFT_361219 [Suillus hirtellus]
MTHCCDVPLGRLRLADLKSFTLRCTVRTAISFCAAGSPQVATLCTDRHRCCQSSNNGEEGETHFLLRGDIESSEGNLE